MSIRFVRGENAAGKQQTRYLHRLVLKTKNVINDIMLIGSNSWM